MTPHAQSGPRNIVLIDLPVPEYIHYGSWLLEQLYYIHINLRSLKRRRIVSYRDKRFDTI